MNNTKQLGIGYHPDSELDYCEQYGMDGHGKFTPMAKLSLSDIVMAALCWDCLVRRERRRCGAERLKRAMI